MMFVTIELSTEMQAKLNRLAAASGLPLPSFLERLIHEQLPAALAAPSLSTTERTAAWRESAKQFPSTPPLSDDAIRRESVYAGPG